MPLESAAYIADLNPAYPTTGDSAGVGDDHIRMIKQVLQNTFPNIGDNPVTATAVQLNTSLPAGIICDWYGSALSVPTGWGICNGSTYAKVDGSGNIVSPNLIDRVRVGAGNLYAQGSTGGAVSATPLITCAPFTITQGNLPNYALTVTDPGHNHVLTDPGHTHLLPSTAAVMAAGANQGSHNQTAAGESTQSSTTGITLAAHTTGITVNSGGSGTAITVAATCATFGTIAPYLALYPIIKL